MKTWSVQDAKARFSALLDTCLAEGPQLVTRRGAEAAVLVPLSQWQQLEQNAQPTLIQLLLQPEPRFELDIPPRHRARRPPLSLAD